MTLNEARLISQRIIDRMERFANWIFQTKICMFICVSGTILIFYLMESFLNLEDNVDSLDYLDTYNDSSSTESNVPFSSSPFEHMPTFILSVIGLYISLFFLWKCVVFLLFGELKTNEFVAISKLLLRFVIFRFIILSGAINPARLTSLFGWLIGFSILGFLHMLSFIITSRCNQISASGSVSTSQWVRIFLAFSFIFAGCWYFLKIGLENCFLLADIDVSVNSVTSDLSGGSFISGFKSPTVLGALKAKVTGKKELLYDAVDVIALLLSEFALLTCKILHLAINLTIQAYDRWRLSKGHSWTYQSVVVCYSDLIFVCLYHLIEISHYLHLLLWSRVFSVASLVVFLHIRVSYSIVAAAISRYMAQRRLTKYIVNNYQFCTLSTDEKKSKFLNLSDTDKPCNNLDEVICAICWETMVSWRRLPCRHDFHEHCLRAWLEQNPSCPTCRLDLEVPPTLLPNYTRANRSENVALGMLVRNMINNLGVENVAVGHQQQQQQQQLGLVNQQRFIHQNQIVGLSRIFSSVIGLNFGVNIGPNSLVTQNSTSVVSNTNDEDSLVIVDSFGTEIEVTDDGSSIVQNTNQGVVNANNNNNANNEVTHRTFHFDGSRYFSWLPMLHVELSEVFREFFQIGGRLGDLINTTLTEPNTTPMATFNQMTETHPPGSLPSQNETEEHHLPHHLRSAVSHLVEMFPQFPRHMIVHELLATGVPELAAENLIARPPPSIQLDATSSSPSAANVGLSSHEDSNQTVNIRNNQLNSTSNEFGASNPIANVQSTSQLSTTQSCLQDDDCDSVSANNSISSRRKAMLAKARRLFLAKHSISN